MTRTTWVLVLASVLISCLLREGQGFPADERKKIVMVSTSSDYEQLPAFRAKNRGDHRG